MQTRGWARNVTLHTEDAREPPECAMSLIDDIIAPNVHSQKNAANTVSSSVNSRDMPGFAGSVPKLSPAELAASEANSIYATTITVSIIATASVVLRFLSRKRTRTPLGGDDYVIALALVAILYCHGKSFGPDQPLRSFFMVSILQRSSVLLYGVLVDICKLCLVRELLPFRR